MNKRASHKKHSYKDPTSKAAGLKTQGLWIGNLHNIQAVFVNLWSQQNESDTIYGLKQNSIESLKTLQNERIGRKSPTSFKLLDPSVGTLKTTAKARKPTVKAL